MTLLEFRRQLVEGFEPDFRVVANITQREIVEAIDAVHGEGYDRTPGLWQSDVSVIVLDKVSFCRWSRYVRRESDNNVIMGVDARPVVRGCTREKADVLEVLVVGRKEPIVFNKLDRADAFVRTLNMFHETRSRDLTPKI